MWHFLRHGEPVGGNRYRGSQIDDPLSDTGWQQLRHAVAKIDVQAVVSSPMQRCFAFAQWFAAEQGLPLQVVEEFKEIGFGRWEGLTRAEIKQAFSDEYATFHADYTQMPQGAEAVSDFAYRVQQGLTILKENYAEKNVLVVAHAGVLRMVVREVLQQPLSHWYRIQVPYATRIPVEYRAAGDFLLHWPVCAGE